MGIGDTGLDYDMPWFRDISEPIGPGHRKIIGYDTTYGDDYDADSPGHGTQVAGIVGGNRTDIDGLNSANGAAPKAKLFIQDLTPGSSYYVYPPSDLGFMFGKAYETGATLHTDSWGGGDNSYGTPCQTTDRFLWEDKYFLAFFSNGNGGPGTGTVVNPAAAKNVISVGASLNGSGAENLASFSSNGLTADGRIKPTVVAPGDGSVAGGGIISADSDGLKDSFNSGTIAMSGTSMSAPAVAGAAALVRQYFVDGFYPGGTANKADGFIPSAALIKAVIINSAQEMNGLYTDGPIPSTGQGWGRINLSNALTFTGDAGMLNVFDEAPGLNTGETWEYSLFSDGNQPLKATLVWTDYPGAPGAAKALVNDLDLTVTSPDGAVYKGNAFSGGSSVSNGTADALNVEEQVLIKTPLPGNYNIRISAANVPYGPQPFALVVTGASRVTSRGSLTLDRTRYNASGTVVIRLLDRDLNVQSQAQDEAHVVISSNTEIPGEDITLVETGPDTGIFSGSVRLIEGESPAGDGYLGINEGDTITATYLDADNGSGQSVTVTASAVADFSPPVISAVDPSPLGDTFATINWNTDEPADSEVGYGESAALGLSVSDSRLTGAHSVYIGNLKEGKTYYYEVKSTDEAGNSGTNNNGGNMFAFTTLNLPPSLSVYSSRGLNAYMTETVIYGTSLDPSGVASVKVNGRPASYRSSDGYYELTVPVEIGPNTITVVSTDTLGNSATKSIVINVPEPPDLVLTSVTGPSSGSTNSPITINAVAKNQGTGPAGSTYVSFYLSADAIITPDDRYLGSVPVASLSPGAETSVSGTFTVPYNVAPGNYYMGAIIDKDNRVAESVEDNNTAVSQTRITIGIGPDLVITSVSGPASGSTNGPITLNAAAKNQGTGTAGSTYVSFYLSTDATITTNDRYLGSVAVASLSPGAQTSVSGTFTVPSNFAAGPYYIGAIIDKDNRIAESVEGNNTAVSQTRITIGIGPDLVISSVSGPASGARGTKITINAVTKNQGTGTAGSTYVSFYLSTDTNITPYDRYLGSVAVASLAPGVQTSVSGTFTVSSSIAAGKYYLGAIIDKDNRVTESDETNNTKVAANQITIQ